MRCSTRQIPECHAVRATFHRDHRARSEITSASERDRSQRPRLLCNMMQKNVGRGTVRGNGPEDCLLGRRRFFRPAPISRPYQGWRLARMLG